MKTEDIVLKWANQDAPFNETEKVRTIEGADIYEVGHDSELLFVSDIPYLVALENGEPRELNDSELTEMVDYYLQK